MKIKVRSRDHHWLIETEDGQALNLDLSLEYPITDLVAVLREQHPGVKLDVADDISPSPFVRDNIRLSHRYGLAVDWEGIAQMMSWRGGLDCTHCKRKGSCWFSISVHCYECNNCHVRFALEQVQRYLL